MQLLIAALTEKSRVYFWKYASIAVVHCVLHGFAWWPAHCIRFIVCVVVCVLRCAVSCLVRTLAHLDSRVHSAFQVRHARGVVSSPGHSHSLNTTIERFVADCSATSGGGARDWDQHRWVVLITDMTGRNCDDSFCFVCKPPTAPQAALASGGGGGGGGSGGATLSRSSSGATMTVFTDAVPAPEDVELGPEEEPRVGMHGYPVVCVWPTSERGGGGGGGGHTHAGPAAHMTNLVSLACDVKRSIAEVERSPIAVRQPFTMYVGLVHGRAERSCSFLEVVVVHAIGYGSWVCVSCCGSLALCLFVLLAAP